MSAEVVVVTGGGAGLGRAIVQSFARRGAYVGLISRGRERLEDARREVEQLGGRALVIAGDVADPSTTEEAAARVEEVFGPIDVWVNDAMTTVFSPVSEMTPDDYKRVTDVTYLGFVYGTLAALQAHASARPRRPSCRWARRSRIAVFRSSRRTAAPSTPWSASPIPCAPS